MNYRVIIISSAERELDKLAPEVQRRITKRILSLEQNPRPNGAIKMQGTETYRVRVGDYRIIYTIDDESTPRVVAVIHVGHRRDVYR